MRYVPVVLALSGICAGAQAPRPLLLVPQPREAHAEREVALTRGLEIVVPSDASDAFAARDLRDALREFGVPVAKGQGSARIVLWRASSAPARALLAKAKLTLDAAMHDEGYVIVPDGSTLAVIEIGRAHV